MRNWDRITKKEREWIRKTRIQKRKMAKELLIERDGFSGPEAVSWLRSNKVIRIIPAR